MRCVVVQIRQNLLSNPFASSRSSLTCTYKCGNACRDDAPNEYADNAYFGDIARRAFSRRQALKATGVATVAVGGASLLAACSDETSAGAAGTSTSEETSAKNAAKDSGQSPEGMRFTPVEPNEKDEVVIPEGYDQNVLIAWGDPVVDGAPEFDFDKQTPEAQKKQFGFNNDFAGIVEAEDGTKLYCCSHEYTTEPMMFANWSVADTTKDQVDIGLAAHGHTVIAVEEDDKGLLTTKKDKRNRRITGFTEFAVTGPAAGHELLQTSADPSGTKVIGTFNNCSGGITPWGTMLSGEENVDQYFAGVDKLDDKDTVDKLARYSLKNEESDRGWEKYYDRFDVSEEPNEPNRFYWVVEIDPSDPNSTPVKHTALGRFKHEAGQVHVLDDGTVVCYMGDDERFEYIYKFVSSRKYKEGDLKHNMGILDEGTLYVAKFDGNSPESEIDGSGELPDDGKFDGTIEWVPLMTAKADGSAESHVDGMDGAEVCIYARLAGDKVGATRMDRPEDIEPNPVTGKVYAALTNNKYRGMAGKEDGTDGAGREYEGVTEVAPIEENKNGLVLEMDDDHAGTKGTWNLLLVCGDPEEAYTYFGGFDKKQVSPISCPDNLAFDEHGNLWISTDGNKVSGNDGLYAVALDGDRRGETKCFLTVPVGAETCGPVVDPNRVMVNVQHPGEGDEATVENPLSHWPDGGKAQPRPAVVQVVRADGTNIGV
ncbi:PhoX family phosphatase [Corynebacterium sp. TAE3-ERU12]|uniref:PhoX family protein n=1 Tax=Corynebacterium sp. TAE3-ERU12 TaxID=2849491 RepID=UPI001C44F827|nr:PhoX family phosphatase [Corynebacterium sp. TAE3-ERU12]MBV7295924.1 PhoX family phosphatase [Corynebacterium sp. TAE3-ERU12]